MLVRKTISGKENLKAIERKQKITADLTDFKRKKRIRNNDNTF